MPLELPLRPGEAGRLAEAIAETVGGRRLTEEARRRLAGRAATLGLETVRPYFGSLEEDPVHAGVHYVAVDGLAGGETVPLLLRIAPGAAPASGLFPKALLIGRMGAGAGELVLNAIPFGPGDAGAVEVFARKLAPAFLPRARGRQAAVRVTLRRPAEEAARAFEGFRAVRGAASFRVEASAGAFWAVVWAAIRAGHRAGYEVGGDLTEETAPLFTFFDRRPEGANTAGPLLKREMGARLDLEGGVVELDWDGVDGGALAGAVSAALAGVR